MQRILISFSILIIFSTFSFAQKKKNIAVLDLKGEGISLSESRIISSRLRTNLFNTNKFTVVERETMEEIIQEQGLQLSGCTSNECVVEVGKILGVRFIVAGDIGKIGNLFTITITMIDVQTGKILKTATEDCECKIETVLTTSVKNVAQILSGEKEKSSMYSHNNYKRIQAPNLNEISPWEKLGMTRMQYLEYQKYQNEQKGYFFPVAASIVPGIIVHGSGHFVAGDYKTGLILLGIEAVAFGMLYNFGHSSSENIPLFFAGNGLLIGAFLYDLIHTPIYVNKYNNNLKKKYNISLIPEYDLFSDQALLNLRIKF